MAGRGISSHHRGWTRLRHEQRDRDTTTILQPGELLTLQVLFSVEDDPRIDATIVAAYRVVDLDTGLVIASFTEADSDSDFRSFDIVNGHRLAISFDGEISSSQPARFAGGAAAFPDRSFSFDVDALTRIRVIPEPSTAALLGLGLAVPACCRSRHARWAS